MRAHRRVKVPELPEAEVTAMQLQSCLAGQRLAHIQVSRRDIIREGVDSIDWYPGSIVRSVIRQGKSVVLEMERTSHRRYLVAELGMTGLLLLPQAIVKHPQHVHVVITFDQSACYTLRYWNPRRFGRISLLDPQGLERYVTRRFGSDPLVITQEDFVLLLKRYRRRLKPLLMHQQTIAGIGNIYANEILFRSAIHPNAIASQLKVATARRLHFTMQEVLREAIRSGGSSVKDFLAPNGSLGSYKEHHLVYGKENRPCLNRCGSLIQRLKSERSSFFCPTCQKNRCSP